MPSISAVVIALNEEARIGACLERLAWCDELILVDSFSRDQTAAIAEAHQAKVYRRAWDGFAGQKNFGIAQAGRDWILVVEADEEVPSALRDEIRAVLPQTSCNGFLIPRLNVFLGEPVRHSDLYPDYQLRLFRRGMGCYETAHPPHESVRVTGSIGRLREPLIHSSYESVEDFVDRMNVYTTTAARDQILSGKTVGGADLLLRPLARWLKVFVLKKGFLDGHRGLLLAGLYSAYVFVKYAKVWAEGGRGADENKDRVDSSA